MSTQYPDLPFTSFPESIDSFTTWLNILASDGPKVVEYQAAINSGDYAMAQQILATIPSYSQKLVTAESLNKLSQAMLALERFYKTDVQPYTEQKQIEWEDIVNRFSYKGGYSGSTTYVKNNIVSYVLGGINQLFLAIADPPIATLPSNTNYWRVLTIKGVQGESGVGLAFKGDWNSATSYDKNHCVTYDNKLWVSEQNDNIGQSPAEGSDYWTLLATYYTVTYPIQETRPTNPAQGDLWFHLTGTV